MFRPRSAAKCVAAVLATTGVRERETRSQSGLWRRYEVILSVARYPVSPLIAGVFRYLRGGVAISLQGSLLATCYYCYTTSTGRLPLPCLHALFHIISLSLLLTLSLSLIFPLDSGIPPALVANPSILPRLLCPSQTTSVPCLDSRAPSSRLSGTRYHLLIHDVCHREQHPEPYGFWQFK